MNERSIVTSVEERGFFVDESEFSDWLDELLLENEVRVRARTRILNQIKNSKIYLFNMTIGEFFSRLDKCIITARVGKKIQKKFDGIAIEGQYSALTERLTNLLLESLAEKRKKLQKGS